ncbi:MAG TPA: GNAT family N-acetyltransferase [Nitrolancea sp.]|jgi:GNAT superfamily N-acetyltransferase|nr:GNAT family N-acetyltransferase [Nitrolancea sp.]
MIVREAREGDATGIAEVHVASWRTTYRGIVPDAYLDGLSVERRGAMWSREIVSRPRTGGIFVAEDGDQILGFSSCGPNRDEDPDYDGELFAVYLLQPYQGRGLGSQLMRLAARRLAERGFHSMMLWVLATNPARGFYAALGGQELRTKIVDIGGSPLEEVAYGWPDLAAF